MTSTLLSELRRALILFLLPYSLYPHYVIISHFQHTVPQKRRNKCSTPKFITKEVKDHSQYYRTLLKYFSPSLFLYLSASLPFCFSTFLLLYLSSLLASLSPSVSISLPWSLPFPSLFLSHFNVFRSLKLGCTTTFF